MRRVFIAIHQYFSPIRVVAVFGALILVAWALWRVSGYPSPPLPYEASPDLKLMWAYRWADPQELDIPKWLETYEPEKWSPAPENLNNLPGRKGARTLWLRGELPSDLPLHRRLALDDVDTSFEVYAQSRLIYRFGTLEPQPTFSGNTWHSIDISGLKQGTPLYIRVRSMIGNIGVEGTPVITSSSQTLFEKVKDGFLTFLLGFLYLVFAGISLAVLSVARSKRIFATLAWALTVMGFYTLTRNDLFQLLLRNARLNSEMLLISLFSLPAAIIAFSHSVITDAPPLKRLSNLCTSLFLVLLILIAFGFESVSLLEVFEVFLIGITVAFFLIVVRTALQQNTAAKIVAVGMMVFSLTASFDSLVSLGWLHFSFDMRSYPFFHFGMFALVVSMVVAVIHRVITMTKLLEKMSTDLQTKNSELALLRKQELEIFRSFIRTTADVSDKLNSPLLVVKNALERWGRRHSLAEDADIKMVFHAVAQLDAVSEELAAAREKTRGLETTELLTGSQGEINSLSKD